MDSFANPNPLPVQHVKEGGLKTEEEPEEVDLTQVVKPLGAAVNGVTKLTPTSSQSASRRRISRRFGMRRPRSRKQKQEMAKLREVSMRIGGAMYFKKRSSEQVYCEVSILTLLVDIFITFEVL